MMRNDTRSRSYIYADTVISWIVIRKVAHRVFSVNVNNSFFLILVKMKRRQSVDIDNEVATSGDINVHYKRERRKVS
jgi:hypothetical protein